MRSAGTQRSPALRREVSKLRDACPDDDTSGQVESSGPSRPIVGHPRRPWLRNSCTTKRATEAAAALVGTKVVRRRNGPSRRYERAENLRIDSPLQEALERFAVRQSDLVQGTVVPERCR